jgi:hypothetical protein
MAEFATSWTAMAASSSPAILVRPPQEAVMFEPSNPQRDHDRYENSKITRAQLGIQMAKLRVSIRHWYRRLTGREPAER